MVLLLLTGIAAARGGDLANGGRIAGNGNLLDASPVTLDAAALDRCERQQPRTRDTLAGVEVRSITYLSDGPRVKGYMAVPKRRDGKGEKLPCLIYNRGGNRTLGQLTDESAVLRPAAMALWGYVVVASQYRGNAGGEGREEFGGGPGHAANLQ